MINEYGSGSPDHVSMPHCSKHKLPEYRLGDFTPDGGHIVYRLDKSGVYIECGRITKDETLEDFIGERNT